jgi:hypothetical protein
MSSGYKGKNPRKSQTTPEQAFIEGAASLIGGIFRFLFGKGKQKGIASHVAAELAGHWDSVEFHLSTGSHQAVSEADKLLDAALKAAGFAGVTMGERLQAARERFGAELNNKVWEAHKLRNRLAHEVGVQAAEREIHEAVSSFRSALKALGIPL